MAPDPVKITPANSGIITRIDGGTKTNAAADQNGSIFAANAASSENIAGTTIEHAPQNANTSDTQTQIELINALKIYLAEAKEQFQNLQNNRGYIDKAGSFVGRLWNSENTMEKAEEKINQFEQKIKMLEDANAGKLKNSAGDKISFGQAYKQFFDKDFNKEDIDKAIKAQKDFKEAKPYQENYDKYAQALSGSIQKYNENNGKLTTEQSLTDLQTSLKSLIGKDNLSKAFTEKGLNPDNMSAQQKYDFLIKTSTDLLSSKAKEAIEHTQGKTLDNIEWEYKLELLNLIGFDDNIKAKTQNSKDGEQKLTGYFQSGISSIASIFLGPLGSLSTTALTTINNVTKPKPPSAYGIARQAWNDANPFSSIGDLAEKLGIIKAPPSSTACENKFSLSIEEYDQNKGQLKDDKSLAGLQTSITSLLGEGSLSKIFEQAKVNPDKISDQEKYNILIKFSRNLLYETKQNEG